jgi:putative hydrolase of the HAD superfamily
MKYEAVIFDFGGTLVSGPSWSDFTIAARKCAGILSIPGEDFVNKWFEHSDGLITGLHPDYQSYVKYVCAQLEKDIGDDEASIAGDILFDVTGKKAFIPREGAIELLTYLKSNGYKIGLISDCAPDLPVIWPDTPFKNFFDVTLFSSSVGIVKKDPEIFKMAINQLAVEPENCLYIADGVRNELSNAHKLGIHAIQILIPEEVDYKNPFREDWKGTVVSSLTEVLIILREKQA